MIELNENYWETRWQNNQTGWDIGYPSTPLKAYFEQIENKDLSILIPGCGNAYEGEYLVNNGFNNVTLLDISDTAVAHIKERIPTIADLVLHKNFFDHQAQYDLIIEQTFFCALNPELRKAYTEQMHSLLKNGGKLVGILFDDKLNEDHPPFGGSLQEYKPLFSELFEINVMERCKNSIQPRQGREVFINLTKA